jgi:hypothetical protein
VRFYSTRTYPSYGSKTHVPERASVRACVRKADSARISHFELCSGAKGGGSTRDARRCNVPKGTLHARRHSTTHARGD